MTAITTLTRLPKPATEHAASLEPTPKSANPPPEPKPALLRRVKDYFIAKHPNTATPFQLAVATTAAVASATALTMSVYYNGFGLRDLIFTAPMIAGAMALVSGGTTFDHERRDHHLAGPTADDYNYHHVDPQAVAKRSFADHSATTARYTTPLLLGLAALEFSSYGAPFWLTSFITVALNMPQWGGHMHVAAHQGEDASGMMKGLQRRGVSLDPVEHRKHHLDKNDSFFDLMTGWFNKPWLAQLVRYRAPEYHEAEGVTPWPLLSDAERAATRKIRREAVRAAPPRTTPTGLATMRAKPNAEA